MPWLTIDELKAHLGEVLELEKAMRETTDPRSQGHKVYLKLRFLKESLEAPGPKDEPDRIAFVARAQPLVEQRMKAMEAADNFNKVAVAVAEMSELDLVLLQKRLASEDWKERLDAVAAAGALGWKLALDSLLGILDTEEHPFVISKLAKVVGQLGGNPVMPRLVKFLAHPDGRVRANAVEGFEAMTGDDKFSHLMPLIEDPEPRVRANALKAIQALGGPRFGEMVKGMIRHPDEGHRKSVLYVLSAIANPFSRDCLLVMLEDGSSEIRHRAVELLAKRADPTVVQAFAKRLAGDTPVATTKRIREAMETIRTTGSPEVQALVEAELKAEAEAAAAAEAALAASRPPPRPTSDPGPPPGADGELTDPDADVLAPETDTKKLLARMNAILSALPPRERREAESLVKSGRVTNETALQRAIVRMRSKKTLK